MMRDAYDLVAGFAARHGLSEEATQELRLLMRGNYIAANKLGHEPIRPIEAAFFAGVAHLALAGNDVTERFRATCAVHPRSARWIKDHYRRAHRDWLGVNYYRREEGRTIDVVNAMGNAESSAAAWHVSTDETRAARWADFVMSLQGIAEAANAETHEYLQREGIYR